MAHTYHTIVIDNKTEQFCHYFGKTVLDGESYNGSSRLIKYCKYVNLFLKLTDKPERFKIVTIPLGKFNHTTILEEERKLINKGAEQFPDLIINGTKNPRLTNTTKSPHVQAEIMFGAKFPEESKLIERIDSLLTKETQSVLEDNDQIFFQLEHKHKQVYCKSAGRFSSQDRKLFQWNFEDKVVFLATSTEGQLLCVINNSAYHLKFFDGRIHSGDFYDGTYTKIKFNSWPHMYSLLKRK
ncbi:hypothetical protein AAH223_000502 [Enterobacter hormaechei]|nr:hypothetical protein [Enterobacter hormaechei]